MILLGNKYSIHLTGGYPIIHQSTKCLSAKKIMTDIPIPRLLITFVFFRFDWNFSFITVALVTLIGMLIIMAFQRYILK